MEGLMVLLRVYYVFIYTEMFSVLKVKQTIQFSLEKVSFTFLKMRVFWETDTLTKGEIK